MGMDEGDWEGLFVLRCWNNKKKDKYNRQKKKKNMSASRKSGETSPVAASMQQSAGRWAVWELLWVYLRVEGA